MRVPTTQWEGGRSFGMLYLTPVAIGYLTQLILIALITAYFLWHFRFSAVRNWRA